MRYANDVVVLARYQSRQLVTWIEGLLEDRFRLTVNREKTQIVKLHEPGQSLNFLGFTLRYDRNLFGRVHRYLNVFPSATAMTRAREPIRELTGPKRCFVPIHEMIGEINRWSKGRGGYFRHGYPRKSFRELNRFMLLRTARLFRRRSQRAYRTPAGESSYAHLQRLGLRLLWTPHRWFLVHASDRPNLGKPCAGNLHARFEEGGGGGFTRPSAT